MATPCIKICVLDTPTQLCIGCGRTLAEIGSWSQLSEPDRHEIMSQLPARMRVLRPGLTGPVAETAQESADR